jgi:hypothetical protein
MILLIIFGALVVLGVILYFIYLKDEWKEGILVGSLASVLVGLFGLMICGCVGIINNASARKTTQRIEYQERINSINNTRLALERELETSTLTILEVSAYNDSVREFKTELGREQALYKSLWVGLFCCPVCNEFSVDAVSYLYLE